MKRMTRNCCIVSASALACLVLGGTLAVGHAAQDARPPKQAPGKDAAPTDLPPGWNAEDMKACEEAGTPGPMHALLGKQAGTWNARIQMWMAPGTEAMMSEGTNTIAMVMDGRFSQSDMLSEMPGMGTFKGQSVVGFDNVQQKFVGTWIDNHGTGIMTGVGERSSDGKTINWSYDMSCPITKKKTVMRQVETFPDANTMTLEMFCTEPRTGVEFKCMRIDFKRTADSTTPAPSLPRRTR